MEHRAAVAPPLCLLLLLSLAGCAPMPGPAFRETPQAVQRPHPQSVPHTDSAGALLTTFDPQRSFLPLALGGALVDYRRGAARGFADAFAADYNAVAADPEQPLDTLLRAAGGSRVQLLQLGREPGRDDDHPALLDAGAALLVALPRDPADIDAFAEAVRQHPERPVWAMLPAHAMQDLPMPEPSRATALAFAALVHGASGLVWQGEDNYAARNAGAIGISPAPPLDYGIGIGDGVRPPRVATPGEAAAARRLWDAAARINRRIARLKPALLQPDAALGYRLAIATPPAPGDASLAAPVRSLLRPWEDGLLLIVVNLDARSHDLQVRFARDLRDIRRGPGEETSGRLRHDPAEAWLEDRIEAHGVRLYRITP